MPRHGKVLPVPPIQADKSEGDASIKTLKLTKEIEHKLLAAVGHTDHGNFAAIPVIVKLAAALDAFFAELFGLAVSS